MTLAEPVLFTRLRRCQRVVVAGAGGGFDVAAALAGEFGDVHVTDRTSGSTLFVNPLIGIYFTFDLPGLARSVQYLHRLEHTQTLRDVQWAIEEYRATVLSWAPNRLDVFALGSDNGLQQLTFNAGWGDWVSVGASGSLASAPAAVAWSIGHADVFATGTDSTIWHRAWT